LGTTLRPKQAHSERLDDFVQDVLLPRAGGAPFTEAALVSDEWHPSMVYRFLRKDEVSAWFRERGWASVDAGKLPGRGGAKLWQIKEAS
jgi:hypothetical protein